MTLKELKSLPVTDIREIIAFLSKQRRKQRRKTKPNNVNY